ncbi:MAG TPA: hypothetical protein VKB51_02725 [bacterium]|nr:hypothetical protein [bacterium]
MVALMAAVAPAQVWAQAEGNAPIFRRFSTPPSRTETRLLMFEVPVALRPQTDPQAEVTQNQGIGFRIAALPFNRVFGTVGMDFARVRWTPSDPGVSSTEVRTLDANQEVNFWVGHHVIVGFGIGLGILDSLVQKTNGRFEHNLVPYIPVRLGVDLSLWDKVFVGLRAVATPFFATGVEAGHSRLLLEVGWAY